MRNRHRSTTAAPKAFDVDLARLPKMTRKELCALWESCSGQAPPVQRNLLIRELAWRAQAQRHGGFDIATRRLLQSATRAATSSMSASPSTSADTGAAPRNRPRPRKPNTSPKLPAAMRLVREWGGERHEITVVENGRRYRYRDRTYASLTEVARQITGTHQSGPRFFGLSDRSGERRKADATNHHVGAQP
jgi:hypothetical protein